MYNRGRKASQGTFIGAYAAFLSEQKSTKIKKHSKGLEIKTSNHMKKAEEDQEVEEVLDEQDSSDKEVKVESSIETSNCETPKNAASLQAVKRSSGRPKGSKNKKKSELFKMGKVAVLAIDITVGDVTVPIVEFK